MSARVKDCGKLIFDARKFCLVFDQFRENVVGSVATLLFLQPLQSTLTEVGILDVGHQLVCTHGFIPKFQCSDLAEFGHRLAIGADAGFDDILPQAVTDSIVSAGNQETRREALDVPFPWSGQSFIKIVD